MCSVARLTMSEFISNQESAGELHTAAKEILDLVPKECALRRLPDKVSGFGSGRHPVVQELDLLVDKSQLEMPMQVQGLSLHVNGY